MDLAKVWVTLIWFFSMTSMSWCCSPKELRYTAYKIAQFHINYKKSKRKLWITLLENVVLYDCNVLLMFHKANRMVFFNDFNELMLFPKRLKYTAYKIAQFYINNKKSKRKLWITLLENVVLYDCNVLLMFHKANRMVFFNDFNELMLFPKRLKYTAYKIAQFYINNKKSKRKLWITLLENVVLYDCNVLLMFHIANRIVSNLNQSVTITFSLVLMQVFNKTALSNVNVKVFSVVTG